MVVYGYEGCYSCPGTCTHVWGYQQVLGFFSLPSKNPSSSKSSSIPNSEWICGGVVAMRAEFDQTVPVDGQVGIIMRGYPGSKST
jgi:hypothetical protein